MSKSRVILGLDLGSNSIGWALVRTDGENIHSFSPIKLGARIIPSCMDPKKDEPNNLKRRAKRGIRRQIARRARRKKNLRAALVSLGMLPTETDAQNRLFESTSPYALRDKALREKLSLFELGRLFLHLSQRRGFLSNRKSDKDNEKSDILSSIRELAAEMGNQTLGQYFHAQLQEPHKQIRKQFTRRDMYLNEFDRIWDFQSSFYPELLTDTLKNGKHNPDTYPVKPVGHKKKARMVDDFGLKGMIFFQRPIYWPSSAIGRCELERGEKRAPRSDRRFQYFRILSEVCNLRIISPKTYDKRKLTDTERKIIIDMLHEKDSVSFKDMHKRLKLDQSDFFSIINSKRESLDGHKTDYYFSRKERFGKLWYTMPEALKNQIVESINGNADDTSLYNTAIKSWGLSPALAEVVANAHIPIEGYASYSIKAIEKLIPHLEKGLSLNANDESDSAVHAAYLTNGQKVVHQSNTLPSVPKDITNPIVRHLLHEVRRLIHAIIREYGMPDAIHIELAREIKGNREQRAAITKKNEDNKARREKIEKLIESYHAQPTRENVNKYILWQQQGEKCLYSSKPISLAALFSDSGDFQVDHILPRSRTLDNTLANKVLCYANENQDKGNRTPHQWLASGNPEKYEKLVQAVCSMSLDVREAKYKRITCKDIVKEEFTSRQFNDTAYVARKTHEFLKVLGCDVIPVKGKHTAELRRIWQLNNVLRNDDQNVKNRGDHRHHAIDALVIALTNHKTIHKLTELWKLKEEYARDKVQKHLETMTDPEFRDKVETMINSVVVSHKCSRKVKGQLHDEMHYGRTQQYEFPVSKSERPHAKNWQEDEGKLVIRTELKNLKTTDVEDIRDPVVKEIILERINLHHVPMNKSITIPEKVWLNPEPLRMKAKNGQGPLIKKVRLLVLNNLIDKKTGERLFVPIRGGSVLVEPKKRHHIALFDMPGSTEAKPKRALVSVSMLKVTQKCLANRKQKETGAAQIPMVDKFHPHVKDAKFLLSLATNDMVYGIFKGKEDFYVYNTASSTNSQMIFYHHCDARRDSGDKQTCYPNNMKFHKVTVDILGNVKRAK